MGTTISRSITRIYLFLACFSYGQLFFFPRYRVQHFAGHEMLGGFFKFPQTILVAKVRRIGNNDGRVRNYNDNIHIFV